MNRVTHDVFIYKITEKLKMSRVWCVFEWYIYFVAGLMLHIKTKISRIIALCIKSFNVKIGDIIFCLINVYAHNVESDRKSLFDKLKKWIEN